MDRIDVELNAERLVERLLQTYRHDVDLAGDHPKPPRAEDDLDHAHRIVRLTVSAQLKRAGKEMKFVVEGDREDRTVDSSLVRLRVRADVLGKRLADNPGSTLEGIASHEKMGGPYAARLIRLNYLAPDIVAALLNGKQPVGLTASKLIADTRLPLDWRAQRGVLGSPDRVQTTSND